MEDTQGNIWAGVPQKGLLMIPHSIFGFENYTFRYDGDQSGNFAAVRTISENISDRSLWFGSDGGGLFKRDVSGNVTNFTADNSPLPTNSVMDIEHDKEGKLWIATSNGGLVTYSQKQGFRSFGEQDRIGTARTYCLAYDEEDDIIFIGTQGNGFSEIQASTGHVMNTFCEEKYQWVNCLFLDSSGTLWVGTYNGALRFNPRTDEFIEDEINTENSASRVYSITESSLGTIWIGTGEGLISFRRDTGISKIFLEEDGMSNNSVKAVLPGPDGVIWASTSNGLTRISEEDGGMLRFYESDGLQGNEFIGNSALVASNGRLFFGGNNGVTSFLPRSVHGIGESVPPVHFSRLVVNGRTIGNGAQTDIKILDKPLDETDQITLPYSRNSLSLYFAVTEYRNSGRIRFAYKMEKHDKDWIRTKNATTRSANYSELPAGKYKFTVKAFFDGEEDNFSSKSILVRIKPPLYLSHWAFLLYGLILASLALFFLRYFNKERKLAEEKKNSELKELRLNTFTNISSDIKTPLTLVMSSLKMLRESESDSQKKDLFNLMYRNTLRIQRLINQVKDIRNVDNGRVGLHFEETDMVYFTKDIMHAFDHMAQVKKIDFRLISGESTENIWVDRDNFDKVLFNVLSYAFNSVSENGRLSIEICGPRENDGSLPVATEKMLGFRISYTGERLNDGLTDKIFDKFYQGDDLDSKAGWGMGLCIARMFVDLHHGTISARNTDEGVVFAIEIPAGMEHLTDEELSETSAYSGAYDKAEDSKSLYENIEAIAYDSLLEEGDVPKALKSRKKVLLVCRDQDLLSYLKMELRSSYLIDTSTDTENAWVSVCNTLHDAVVTDLSLNQEYDGAVFCEKLKKNSNTSTIPVIVISSREDEQSVRRCVECGAGRYLFRPLTADILKSNIDQEISIREAYRNRYRADSGFDFNDIQIDTPDARLVERVIEAIKRNIDDPDFGVEELSREVGLSRVHMNRKLKECMSTSPSVLIKSIRLKQAAFLLINNKVNVSEVAYRVGFATHSYFSSSFRDFFGMTPKEFVAKYSDAKDDEFLTKLFEHL